MRIFICGISAVLLASCGNQDSTYADPPKQTTPSASQERIALSDKDVLRVCLAGTASRNSRSVDAMKSEIIDKQMVRLSYVRDDGKAFRYDCQIDGDTLRLRMIDEGGPGTGPGIWSGKGSTTTFKLLPKEVEITVTFNDGSFDTEKIKI